MDFTKLKSKLITIGEKALEVSGKALDSAGQLTGQALEKTSDFTADTIKTSRYCIQSGEDYDAISQDRNLVVFVLVSPEDEKSKAILGRLPILLARGWQYSTTVRIIFDNSLPQVARAINITPIGVGIFRDGNLKHTLYNEAFETFIESFDIFFDWSTFQPNIKKQEPTIIDSSTPTETVVQENGKNSEESIKT